ncbi:unnamed protein product [Eruca vesicaria subsp. sativa]|uniref:Uncharacterized protein n=1 Tax=Eruca vesicaria subsp. sativa TaxID=29727 RepID=A0ABC8KRT8_ERUVS|nr:unnamed protein product [Eruca vesicaria subsp. sativa]
MVKSKSKKKRKFLSQPTSQELVVGAGSVSRVPAVELLNSSLDGSLKLEVSFFNALLIPDVFPLLAAAQKALISKSHDSLSTRTLHSELFYNYSGSKHITESLKRCGISETTTYILVAQFNASLLEIL